MKILAFCLAMLSTNTIAHQQSERLTIWMIGDSTMSKKEVKAFPETGWGMPFSNFWDSTVTIENRAANGRSTKSFLAENRWQPILDKIRPGDYVLIQFGHNDESEEKSPPANPATANVPCAPGPATRRWAARWGGLARCGHCACCGRGDGARRWSCRDLQSAVKARFLGNQREQKQKAVRGNTHRTRMWGRSRPVGACAWRRA